VGEAEPSYMFSEKTKPSFLPFVHSNNQGWAQLSKKYACPPGYVDDYEAEAATGKQSSPARGLGALFGTKVCILALNVMPIYSLDWHQSMYSKLLHDMPLEHPH
jgi:hypothetical protein